MPSPTRTSDVLRWAVTLAGAVAVIWGAGQLAGASSPWASASASGATAAGWEVWALEQGAGLDRVHVFDSDLRETAVIEVGVDHGVQVPHMIDFDATNQYAAVASPGSGDVTIISTADYEVVDVIATGAGAHMAAFTPDNESLWVANIGARTFTEISVDVAEGSFELARELDVTEDPLWREEFGEVAEEHEVDPPAPVCHEYTEDSRFAYLTLGPHAHGGLVVVDLDTATIEVAFDREEVRSNCGLARSADGQKMYANWGGFLEDPPEDSDPGEWYVLDTADHALVATHSAAGDDTEGQDPHGVRITPDGSELWQVNRVSNDAIVVDPSSDEIIDELDADALGETPDIIDFSPDGSLAFVSLRGPDPVTAAHAAVGSTPGFAVIDVAAREQVDLVQPAADGELDASDFHGIGVRGPRDVPVRVDTGAGGTAGGGADPGPVAAALVVAAAGGALLAARRLTAARRSGLGQRAGQPPR